MNRGAGTAAEDVRARIFFDHAMLRRAMAGLAREAAAAERGTGGAVDRVRTAAAEVRDAFERHLSYEERVFLPLLREADAWGPVRVTHLLDEHRWQRAVLVAFVEDVTEGGKLVDEIADETAWLIRCLLDDMDEEEKVFRDGAALTASAIVVDQTDG